ncbi:hypothetical protein PAMP_011478 [Pampus punctatissimus]
MGTYWSLVRVPSTLNFTAACMSPSFQGVKRQGQPVLYQRGRMVCNNFNHLGCAFSNSHLLHVCSFCRGANARSTCPHNPTPPAD